MYYIDGELLHMDWTLGSYKASLSSPTPPAPSPRNSLLTGSNGVLSLWYSLDNRVPICFGKELPTLLVIFHFVATLLYLSVKEEEMNN